MAVPGRIARVDMTAIEVGGVTDHVNILLSLTLNHPTLRCHRGGRDNNGSVEALDS